LKNFEAKVLTDSDKHLPTTSFWCENWGSIGVGTGGVLVSSKKKELQLGRKLSNPTIK